MKIKMFKQQLRDEKFDIPNVLDKIKPLAYEMEYPLQPKKSFFFKNILQLVPVLTVFTICILVLNRSYINKTSVPGEVVNYENYVNQAMLYDSYIQNLVTDEPASNFKNAPEAARKDCTSGNYCMWVFDNDDQSNFMIVDEDVFDYIVNYMKENKNCTLIDTIKVTREKYSIPESETYTIRNAYEYIKNNYLLTK